MAAGNSDTYRSLLAEAMVAEVIEDGIVLTQDHDADILEPFLEPIFFRKLTNFFEAASK